MAKKKTNTLPFKGINYAFFIAAVVFIVFGFILLDQGSMTIAPTLLVLGYCVLVPVAIMWGHSKDEKSPDTKR